MAERDRAICLRSYDWSETSQVVCFLTRRLGSVRLVAKGSKRPKSKAGGPIDVLAEGDLVCTVKDQGLGTLIEFRQDAYRPHLRKDAHRLYSALFCIELTGETLAQQDPHPEVFDLLHNALTRLDTPDSAPQAVLAYFQWRLLRRIGLLGDMDACVRCGCELPARLRAWFSSNEGGLICGACRSATPEKVSLDRDTRQALETLEAAEVGRKVCLPDAHARKANRLLCYHATCQIGKPLRSTRHVLGPKS
jgi:DNA repair protein RecO (recombination protein O)